MSAASDATDAAAAAPAAPVFDRETDDLALALHGVAGAVEKVHLSADGRLSAASATAGSASPLPVDTAEAGCRRLTELVHNNLANKVEAIDRDALRHLSAAIHTHDHGGVRVHASRAMRSICFKNEEARARAKPENVLAALVVAISHAAADVEHAAGIAAPATPVASASAASAGGASGAAAAAAAGSAAPVAAAADASASSASSSTSSSSSSSSPTAAGAAATPASPRSPRGVDAATFATVEEAAMTLTSLVNRHETNTIALTEAGAGEVVARAIAAVSTYIRTGVAIKPAAGADAAAGAAGAAPPAATTIVTAAAASLKKLQFLQAMLS